MITFVTGLFDLTPYDQNLERKSISEYLSHGTNILKQKINIVVYIDKSIEEKLRALVKECRPDLATEIIPLSIESLPLWKKRKSFIEGVKPVGCNKKMTPEYMILTWSKFDMMKMAIEKNPFKSSHFVWIDFGISHVTDPEDFERLSEFKEYDKFRICKYWTSWYPLCIDFVNVIGTVWSQTPAGLWMTTPENFPKIYSLFFEHGNYVLSLGKVCLEEDILTYLRNKFPEYFDLFYGTYSALIRSFYGDFIMTDWSIRINIQNMLHNNSQKENAIELAKLVLKAVDEGKYTPETPELIPFLKSLYIVNPKNF